MKVWLQVCTQKYYMKGWMFEFQDTIITKIQNKFLYSHQSSVQILCQYDFIS